MKCVHGLDSRFCAVCNKASAFSRPRGAIGSATLAEILAFLNAEQVRATYGAVGELLGLNARDLVAQLGDRGVDSGGGADLILSGTALAMRMTAWKARTQSS